MMAHEEYMRRNLVVCSAYGAKAGVGAALVKLRAQRRPAKWLLTILDGVSERAEKLPPELARWRDAAPDVPLPSDRRESEDS